MLKSILVVFELPFKILGFPFAVAKTMSKMLLFAAFIAVFLFFLSQRADAACLGANHIPYTSGSRAECQYKYNKKHLQAEVKDQSGALSSEVEAWERSLKGEQQYIKRIGYDKLHSLQINWGIYYMPHELGYRRQFTTHFAPSSFTYHYYFNPSLSVGTKYQAYRLEGNQFTDGQGSDSLDVMRWWGHATFHFDVSPGWEFYGQMGMVIMDSSRVWLNGVAKADPVGEDQFLAEFGLVYYVGSNKAIAGIKFNDAPNGSSDITTYHNLGDAELFAGIELGIF